MHRFFSIITVVLFVLFLSIPPLVTVLTPDQKISSSEKRKLEILPDFEWSVESVMAYPAAFEHYYNDHFGMRDLFVLYQQLFSAKILKVSSSPAVTVGADGWLFFNGDGALDAFLGLKQLSPVHLQSYQWELMNRRDWLAEQGITYVFLPVPNKESIYPEYLPWWIRDNAGISLYDQIVGYLDGNIGFSEYIDLKKRFLKQKNEKQLYLMTDSHWNLYGVFFAYNAITRVLKDLQIPIRVLKNEEIVWSTKEFSGDLAVFLHLYGYFSEIAPEIEGIEYCEETIEKQRQGTVFLEEFADDPRNFVMTQKCGSNDTSVLIIYDSFGRFLWPFMFNSFGTVYYVNHEFADIKDFIVKIRPDVLIDQRVERNLLPMLTTDRVLEHEVLKKQFPALNNVLLQINGTSVAEDYISSSGVEVFPGDDGLLVRSKSKYPALKFQFDNRGDKVALLVNIRLSSPVKTKWLLYYTTESAADFLPEHTISMDVQKGENEFFFRLPNPGKTVKLQFYPGIAPADYLLHSFVIKKQNELKN